MRRRHLIALLLVLGLAAAAATCSPGYVLRAGVEEARILAGRRPIAELVASAGTPEETRRQLALVQQARTFAEAALGLDAGESYTTFSAVDRDTLLMVVSGARKDRFEQVTWWFPIVGHVPYKGYFDFERADAEAARLEREGYDAYVRPSGAFSTLGWFNDPLLSTLLRYGDVDLVGTVIHELTHNTVYLPSQAAFNESFATFVGDVGAAEYFCNLEGPEGERCGRARAIWRDEVVFGAFLQSLIAELEALYGRADLDAARKLELRERVFEDARERFRTEVQPRFQLATYASFLTTPLNNATLIARRLYYHRLDRFEAAHLRLGGDLARTVAAITAAVEDGDRDPYEVLEEIGR